MNAVQLLYIIGVLHLGSGENHLQFSTHSTDRLNSITILRGGLVPEADEKSGIDYYDKFELDYGRIDKRRVAGSLRGFLTSGKLTSLEEQDRFFSWINEHLEAGPEVELEARMKPFYVSFPPTFF